MSKLVLKISNGHLSLSEYPERVGFLDDSMVFGPFKVDKAPSHVEKKPIIWIAIVQPALSPGMQPNLFFLDFAQRGSPREHIRQIQTKQGRKVSEGDVLRVGGYVADETGWFQLADRFLVVSINDSEIVLYRDC